mmetsp:Transcript_18985/g.52947  ORF Transcript_18985/g.52947 Transcript_18985/m.52947 type:complete len:251 (-) Transcript_18985:203-955(-)
MLFGILVILVVEEDSPQTTSFVSVLNDEITIGPFLEFLVVSGVVLVADLLVSSVEVLHIVLVHVTRGDIGTSAEPPNTSISLEVSVVEVHGRAVRVFGVHHTTQTTGEERNTFAGSHTLGTIDTTFGGSLESLLRHASVDNTEVDSGLFKDISARQDTGHTATSVGTSPGILLEFSISVNFLDGTSDFDLGLAAHFFEFGSHREVSLGTISFAYETVGNCIDSSVGIPTNVDRRSVLSDLLPFDLFLGLG